MHKIIKHNREKLRKKNDGLQKYKEKLLREAASKCGGLDTVKRLIAEKVDINCTLTINTPLECAASNNRVEIVEYLIQQGADLNKRSKTGWVILRININYQYIRQLFIMQRT